MHDPTTHTFKYTNWFKGISHNENASSQICIHISIYIYIYIYKNRICFYKSITGNNDPREYLASGADYVSRIIPYYTMLCYYFL